MIFVQDSSKQQQQDRTVRKSMIMTVSEMYTKYYAEIRTKLEYDLGLEYKKNLEKIDPNDPEREAKACFKTKNSPAAALCDLSYGIFGDIVNPDLPAFDGMLEYQKALKAARTEFCLTLTDEEKETLDNGIEITRDEPRMIHHKTPEGVGILPAELELMKRESYDTVSAGFDYNWSTDEMMDNNHIFSNVQLDSEFNKRMENHYLSLENPEQKLDFIINGIVQNNVDYKFSYKMPVYDDHDRIVEGNDTVVITKNKFSDAEKEEFERCVMDYLSPKTADGQLDMDEFERRMDALATKYSDLKIAQGKFIQDCIANKNNDNFTIPGAEDLGTFKAGNEEYVSELVCPEALKAEGLKKCIISLIDSEKLNNEAMHEYCNRKTVYDVFGEKKNFFQAFDKTAKEHADTDQQKSARYNLATEEKDIELTNDQEEAIKQYGNKVAIASVREASDKNNWKEPWKDITLDDLKKIHNLYTQMVDADHWYHINSGEYKQLLGSMKVASELYTKISDRGRLSLTGREKRDIQNMFDNIRVKSTSYLSDKAEKERGTDLGKDRYEIAISALDVASHGKAKETVEFHNTHRVKKGKKTISFAELNERKAQTSDERKETIKARREAARNSVNENQGLPLERRNH